MDKSELMECIAARMYYDNLSAKKAVEQYKKECEQAIVDLKRDIKAVEELRKEIEAGVKIPIFCAD